MAFHSISFFIPNLPQQIGFCFVCAMGCGIIYFEMTTDPVELWAAPASQSRMDKDIYDINFDPFYRIEQVIIKSNYPSFNSTNTESTNLEFGPAFNEDFLLAVWQLQNDLISMKLD